MRLGYLFGFGGGALEKERPRLSFEPWRLHMIALHRKAVSVR